MKELTFPPMLFVSHYDHSTPDTPSFNANTTERGAVDADSEAGTLVAQYKLVVVKRLALRTVEISDE